MPMPADAARDGLAALDAGVKTLAQLGIKNGSTLYLLHPLRGGGDAVRRLLLLLLLHVALSPAALRLSIPQR